MATNYPGSLDTATQQPSPSASTEMDDSGYEHDLVHSNASGAIIALETKLGVGSTTAAGASTNHVLVKQADGDTEWAAAPSSTPTVITVADTTDTSCSVAVFESATGDLAPKTDGGLTYNAGTGTLTATAFSGPLTGNVTGNTSGTALTVTQAAQTAITSVGTLTALTVNGVLTVSGAGNGILLDGLNSSNANTLDDYEEGTFDVTATVASGTLTVDTNRDTLKYTKIGNRVFIMGQIEFTTASTPSGAWSLSGLPFTNTNTGTYNVNKRPNIATAISTPASDIDPGSPFGWIEANTTTITMAVGGIASSATLNANHIDTGTHIFITGQYVCDS